MKFVVILVFLFIPVFVSAQNINDIPKGIELYNSGKLNEAKSLFEKLVETDTKIDSLYFYLGRIYYDEKEFDDAEECLEKAVELSPRKSDYHYWLGRAYLDDARDASIFSKMSLASSAKESFINTLKIDPNHLKARIFLANYLFRAPGIAGGDTEEAIKEAKIVLEKDEKEGRVLLANIYNSEEKFNEAEIELQKLEKCCSDDKSIYLVYNMYGYLLLNQKRYDEAIQKFEKQIKLAPENANAHDSLAEAYLLVGRKDDAIKELKIALQINPGFESSKEKLEELENK